MNTNYKGQAGQDKEILKLLNYKKNGFFLDIGCADAMTFSNTYVLEKDFNWTGICVDPRKASKESFQQHRTAIFEHSAIYTYSGKIAFSDLGVYAGVNDVNVTDKLAVNPRQVYDVECITLNDLFNKYNVPSVIDYMSLDVEGAELLILETFPFDKYRLLTASVEHNSHIGQKQKEKADKIVEVMEKNNFKLHRILCMDFVFIHKSLIVD
jgi:FkbM family methyltransferase